VNQPELHLPKPKRSRVAPEGDQAGAEPFRRGHPLAEGDGGAPSTTLTRVAELRHPRHEISTVRFGYRLADGLGLGGDRRDFSSGKAKIHD
jgi:hypothetical protein